MIFVTLFDIFCGSLFTYFLWKIFYNFNFKLQYERTILNFALFKLSTNHNAFHFIDVFFFIDPLERDFRSVNRK